MARIERIVCAVDFSDCSRRAVDYALAIARWYNATVTALHVVPPLLLAPYVESAGYPIAIQRRPEALDDIRLQLSLFVEQESGDFPVNAVVAEGGTVNEIVRFAQSSAADLVVVGTHGRSGFQRFMLGSVTESVLRHAACPVLTVPPLMHDAVPVGPQIFERVLCAVDFSPSSLAALDYASSLAEQAHAALTVLHVVEPIADYVAVTVAGIDNEILKTAAERHLHALLSERLTNAARATPVLRTGKSGPEILAAAEKEAADLIVLGVAGRSAADIMWFGSTANHVVRRAICPVLTLRS